MQNLEVQTLTLDEMTQLDAGASANNYDYTQGPNADGAAYDVTNNGYSLESMWSFEA